MSTGNDTSAIDSALNTILSLTQQATSQVQGTSATSDIAATPDADAPSLSDALELVKSILELISAIIVSYITRVPHRSVSHLLQGLVSSIVKLSGNTASVVPIG